MNLLPMVKLMRSTADSVFKSAANFGSRKSQFPSWVTREGRKLLEINKGQADVIVSRDGTGNYTHITQAVDYAPKESLKPYIIHIKKGIYNEYVNIKSNKWNIVMVGDGMGETVITADHNYFDGWTTFKSTAFGVAGKGFIAQDLTIENVSGPDKFQAVALRVDFNHSVFYKVEIKGFQDTLYAHTMHQFYRECKISRTVDFIFGSSTTVFQKYEILARKGMPVGGIMLASALKEREVRAQHEIERQKIEKTLNKYILTCRRMGVQAESLFIEMDSIETGILELISKHAIKKLAMGAAADKYYSK